LSAVTETSDCRTLSPSQVLSWLDNPKNAIRLRNDRDVLPGGFMAAAIPGLIDWEDSDLHGQHPFIVLRNVSCGGNPLEKTTVLHSARVPLDGIESAEFTLVPFGRGGRFSPLQHAQIRFVFEPGNQPELLNVADSSAGADALLPDLVTSWISWQRPNIGWSLRQGMDDDIDLYPLSMRVLSGSQMLLEDSLRERDWFSYRLRLPGGREGLSELFRVAVTLGDGVGRHTLAHMLDCAEEEWLRGAPPADDTRREAEHEWQELKDRVRETNPLALEVGELPEDRNSYHPLMRSCATLARYSLLLTAHRLIGQGKSEGVVLEKLPEPVIDCTENWMRQMAHSGWRNLLHQAPKALHFILKHHEAIPPQIPGELHAAGLLDHESVETGPKRYGLRASNPYGSSFFV